MKPVCGLLGEKLSHSYSPQIHALFADYEYKLHEKAPEEVENFILNGDFTGLNVTIPYKKTVLPFMSEISPTVQATGSVNTVIRRKDGSLYGDNTDVYGFTQLVLRSKIDVGGKKALVLGSGGSSLSVIAGLKALGAIPVVISRSGENNYDNLDKHSDARIIVNTTPLGMYPNNGRQALSLKRFENLEAVYDLIYNPSRTALLLEADELGIPAENGLYMLVAQAKRSSELFQDSQIDDGEIERVYRTLSSEMLNIALIGMPGCGKSGAAKGLARLTGRQVIDCDEEILNRSGLTAGQYIEQNGEAAFRQLETEILAEVSKLSGNIISTGGGVVTIPENYPLLKQNSIVVWLKRDLSELSDHDRPISKRHGVEKLYKMRKPLYERFSDIQIEVAQNGDETAKRIVEAMTE